MTTTAKRRSVPMVLPADASVDDLFPTTPPPTPPPTPTPSPKRHTSHGKIGSCAVCGLGVRPKAHLEHSVCTDCVRDPEATRADLEQRRRDVITQQRQAAREAQAAYDALTPDERARWDKLCWMRARRDAGDATDDEVRLLQRSRDALVDPDDARYSGALRRVFHADEGLFWANAACEEGQRRINVKIAALVECVDALKAGAPAEPERRSDHA